MSVIATVLCIVINAVVWFGAMKGLKLLHVYFSRPLHDPRSREMLRSKTCLQMEFGAAG